jgi:hypothetical protein
MSAVNYLALGSAGVTIIGMAAVVAVGSFYLLPNPWHWFVVAAAVWLVREFFRWSRTMVRHQGQQNELEWLNELASEQEAGTHDHSDTLRRLINTIEREHEPSRYVKYCVEHAREILAG